LHKIVRVSAVYGMPKAAIEAGAAVDVLPVEMISSALMKRSKWWITIRKRRCLGRRVFLVDDQLIVAEGIRRMLAEESDIDFHYCQDSTDAINAAEKYQPTVILQDLVMPGIDGMTLLRLLNKSPATSKVPVIVLSSKEDPKIKSEAL